MMRIVFTIPGLICSGILASSGVNINWITTSTITRDLNSSEVWSEATTNHIILVSPVWIMVHTMFFLVLMWFIVSQVMILMTKQE